MRLVPNDVPDPGPERRGCLNCARPLHWSGVAERWVHVATGGHVCADGQGSASPAPEGMRVRGPRTRWRPAGDHTA